MGNRGAKYREIRGGREATAPPERWGIQNPKRIKIDGSALAAEICTGPHNRLLRRQHCSSLCLQSEGHEHVANMTSALGHNFVDFQLVLGRHNIRPPHFASKVSYSASPQTFAACSCSAPCSGAANAMLFGQKLRRVFSGFSPPPLHPTQKTVDVGLQCFIVRIVQEEIAQLRLFAFWHLQGNPCACLFCRHVVAHHDAF